MKFENIQELSVILKEVESELLNNRDWIRLLLKNNEELNSEVDSLKYKIKSKDENINGLKEENSLLKSSLEHLKNLIYNLVKFLLWIEFIEIKIKKNIWNLLKNYMSMGL